MSVLVCAPGQILVASYNTLERRSMRSIGEGDGLLTEYRSVSRRRRRRRDGDNGSGNYRADCVARRLNGRPSTYGHHQHGIHRPDGRSNGRGDVSDGKPWSRTEARAAKGRGYWNRVGLRFGPGGSDRAGVTMETPANSEEATRAVGGGGSGSSHERQDGGRFVMGPALRREQELIQEIRSTFQQTSSSPNPATQGRRHSCALTKHATRWPRSQEAIDHRTGRAECEKHLKSEIHGGKYRQVPSFSKRIALSILFRRRWAPRVPARSAVLISAAVAAQRSRKFCVFRFQDIIR